MRALFIFLLFSFLTAVSALPDVDVVILGAGITGVTAGRELDNQGKTFVILEATNSPGGRIRSEYHPDPRFPKPVELGANWVHEEFINPLYPVLLDMGVEMVIFDQDDSSVWNNKGQSQNYNQIRRLLTKCANVWTWSNPFRQTGVSDAQSILQGGYAFDDPQVETYYQFAYEQWVGNNLEYHDSLMWDTSTADTGPDHIIPAGYITVINKFLDGIPPNPASSRFPDGLRSIRSNLYLNSPVTKIEYERPNGKARVTYRDSAGMVQTIFANKGVIVTASINVLKAGMIEFVPPLPSPYITSMNKLMCSEANKVALYFDSVGAAILAQGSLAHHYMFRYGQPNGGLVRLTDGLTCFINWKFVSDQAVVTSYYVGDFSRYMETLSDEVIIQKHLAALRQFVNLPDPIDYRITRWGQMPYAKCSYTDFAVGGRLSDLQQLAVPIGTQQNLHLAGEASNFPNHGTVHAGYMSALQAVAKIP